MLPTRKLFFGLLCTLALDGTLCHAADRASQKPGGLELPQYCASNPDTICRSIGVYAQAANGSYRDGERGSTRDQSVVASRSYLRAHGFTVDLSVGLDRSSATNREINGWLVASRKSAEGKSEYVFAIEGTADKNDIRDDVYSNRRSIAFGNIQSPTTCNNNSRACVAAHAGFVDHANALLSDTSFSEKVRAAALDPNARIVFTGHSLGAATATLIGAEVSMLSNRRAQSVEVVGFATPATFYGDISRDAPEGFRVTNVINPDDPVAQIPQAVGLSRLGQDYLISNPLHQRLNPFDAANLNASNHGMSKYLDRAIEIQATSMHVAFQIDDTQTWCASKMKSLVESGLGSSEDAKMKSDDYKLVRSKCAVYFAELVQELPSRTNGARSKAFFGAALAQTTVQDPLELLSNKSEMPEGLGAFLSVMPALLPMLQRRLSSPGGIVRTPSSTRTNHGQLPSTTRPAQNNGNYIGGDTCPGCVTAR